MKAGNNKRFNALFLSILSLASISSYAANAPVCMNISGNIKLDVDPKCNITTLYPGNAYLGLSGIPNSCFVFKLSGGVLGPATAYSGFTNENMISMTGGVTSTPGKLVENGVPQMLNETGAPETRRFITSRTVVSLFGGKIYTADAGIYGLDSSTEQLIITKGDGFYSGVTGQIQVNGKLFQPTGNYVGKLCFPK